MQSDQEEGDSLFVLHALNDAQLGYETIIVYSRDLTDRRTTAIVSSAYQRYAEYTQYLLLCR